MKQLEPQALDRTLAARTANANWRANLSLLRHLQPAAAELADSFDPTNLEYLFARDGSLTARTETAWHAGMSAPRATAASMLKKLDVVGSVACFLAPPHAAHVRHALAVAQAQQAMLCIIPDAADLSVLLHCDDFTTDLSAKRLWFLAGEQWGGQLARLLDSRPGLCTPNQFIRLMATPQTLVDALVADAQKIFGDANARRAKLIELTRAKPPGPSDRGRLCAVIPSRYRLWNDVESALATVLAEAVGSLDIVRFDPDDPVNNSPASLAAALAGCGGILTVNTARADLPGVAPESVAWITWVTGHRIPRPTLSAPHDRLIVADPARRPDAIDLGWPCQRVQVGTWPAVAKQADATNSRLAIIADTAPLLTPKDIEEYSSHRLLWEQISAQLLADPFKLSPDPGRYLDAVSRALNIAPESLDRRRFFDHLILPAYQQGLARTLLASGFPLDLFGDHWNAIEDLSKFSKGRVRTKEAFEAAVQSAAALVHVWPDAGAHPIEFTGRPTVRRERAMNPASARAAFLRDAKLALAGHGTPPAEPDPVEQISVAVLIESLEI